MSKTMAPFMAYLTRDGQRLVMARGPWRLECPAADVVKWRDLHRKLWGRRATVPGQPGPYAAFYDGAVAVLDRLCREFMARDAARKGAA